MCVLNINKSQMFEAYFLLSEEQKSEVDILRKSIVDKWCLDNPLINRNNNTIKYKSLRQAMYKLGIIN